MNEKKLEQLEKANIRRAAKGDALRGGLVTGRGAAGATPASWSEISPDAIAATIELVTQLRGAIRFGTSRDGAVFGITVYLGEQSETFWGRDVAACEADLQTIYAWAEQLLYEKGHE